MTQDVVIEGEGLRKLFRARAGGIASRFADADVFCHAVDGVTFQIRKGETFGLVGESGCGKTTTGLLLIKLIELTDGKVKFDGVDINSLNEDELKALRSKMQIIFQNPYDSLNSRMTILDIVAEPLRLLKIYDTEYEVVGRVKEVMEEMGLSPPEEFLHRFPHELSGGQRQRVGVARAFGPHPKFVVADEPVSMLDVSIRTGVLKVMKELIEKHETAFLFITHDLALARYMCERIAVMYLGRIMEIGPTEDVIHRSLHPYTKALIAAVPVPDPDAQRTEDIPIKGEVTSGIDLPEGCRFNPRCPYAKGVCFEEEPELVETGNNHSVACHRYQDLTE